MVDKFTLKVGSGAQRREIRVEKVLEGIGPRTTFSQLAEGVGAQAVLQALKQGFIRKESGIIKMTNKGYEALKFQQMFKKRK